jgi:hypothetical protein
VFSIHDEISMELLAEQRGIFRLETQKCLNYEEAQNIAKTVAEGLPTLEELQISGVNAGDNVPTPQNQSKIPIGRFLDLCPTGRRHT